MRWRRACAGWARTVPFGNDLIFAAENLPDFALHVEDLRGRVDADPAEHLCGAGGATVLANLSASNITVGKADYRREFVRGTVGQVHRRVFVFGGGAGRIDDRFGVGRARADLRERLAAGGVAALCRDGAGDRGGHRPGAAGAGSDAAHEL